MSPQIKCPAAQEEHPVLSRNRMDVQCRVEGGLRPAEMPPDPMGGTEPIVCCADYWQCAIWRSHKELESIGTMAQRATGIAPMKRHVPDFVR